MITTKRKFRLLCYLIPTILLLFPGCAPKIQLTILKPAEVTTSGIKKVAVGRFELAEVNRIFKIERNGTWQTQQTNLSKKQKTILSNQIRARVISLLSTTPYFNLVYTDEFNALDNDTALQNAISTGGFKTSEADAVINGKIWLDVINTDGVELEPSELEYMQGGQEGSFNYKVQVLAFWPYKSIRGTLALEMKMTRLNPTEIVAVTFDTRSYSHKVGGKPVSLEDKVSKQAQSFSSDMARNRSKRKGSASEIEESELVLPNFDQIVSDLAESIAAQFVRRVAVTQQVASYPIASGGDSTAKMLIEAGAYEKAIDVISNTLNRSGSKNPNDIYNLGLCFEAIGDYGLAAVTYEDAVTADPKNLMFAQGVGRINRLKRENRRLKDQLSNQK